MAPCMGGDSRLLARVAALQPEMAARIVQILTAERPAVAAQCLHCPDAEFRRHVDAALALLFEREARMAEEDTSSKTFRDGPGHSLLGASPSVPAAQETGGGGSGGYDDWAATPVGIADNRGSPSLSRGSQVSAPKGGGRLGPNSGFVASAAGSCAKPVQQVSAPTIPAGDSWECDAASNSGTGASAARLLGARPGQVAVSSGRGENGWGGDSASNAGVGDLSAARPEQVAISAVRGEGGSGEGGAPNLDARMAGPGARQVQVASTAPASGSTGAAQPPAGDLVNRPGRCEAGRVSRKIWGLQEFFQELDLGEYVDQAAEWSATMGAAFLEELVENQEELASELKLKPLEKRRLFRQGPQVAARLVSNRPARATTSQLTSSTTASAMPTAAATSASPAFAAPQSVPAAPAMAAPSKIASSAAAPKLSEVSGRPPDATAVPMPSVLWR
eukprot:TRINITY_DN28612_c0_g1_i1.p1 TRINITY_DN28612_c0_g1~~TRINITY_DN28612_c0_g1_i1.p1  ORF type:complete len:447 (+),score=82.51 TRINITY_DN28612_c0_g1_i1:65-1405(+)